MNEVWRKHVGRWDYYVLLSESTGRWMLCRAHEDPRDDDMVAQGVAHRTKLSNVLSEIRDELRGIAEEIE